MKNILTTLVLVLIFAFGLALAQNITNTLGTGGLFTIKDGSTNYFTLSQSTGNVSLFRNLELGGDSVSTSTRGVITKNGRRFIHNYQVPGTNGFNTFIGLEAGNFTMSGTLFSASRNTGVGYKSLHSLTMGYNNSAFGTGSLQNNTTGNGNSAFGTGSLQNTITGSSNSAFGGVSLFSNTTGYDNSAFGLFSLYYNTSGYRNSVFGSVALYSNTTGFLNTALGYGAGYYITTGSNNITIGYDAQVPDGTASNQIRLGNTSITYAGIQVAWTVTSDRRYKDNITPIGLGLGFISKLNPVSYVRKNDENKKTEYGLIAQEVEQVLKELGIENHAMLTITDEGMYELRYNDLMAPMIKAIQELKEQKDTEIAKLKEEKDTEIAKLKNELNDIKQIVIEVKNKQEDMKIVKSVEK